MKLKNNEVLEQDRNKLDKYSFRKKRFHIQGSAGELASLTTA